MTRRPALDRLTSLRAFAALAVFGYHLEKWGVWSPLDLASVGYVGVGFFFVLSGFILVWASGPGDRARDFYGRRFARVYPTHFAMLLLTAVLPVVAVSRGWPEAITSATLVQAWFPRDDDIVYGMNAVSWSLSCEAAFYAAFPLAVLWLRRASRPLRWTVALGWYVAASVFVVAATIDGGYPVGIAFVNPAIRFAEFLLGVVAGLEIADGWRPRGRFWFWAAVVVALNAVAVATSMALPLPDALFALPFLGLVVAAATTDLAAARGPLANRWLIYAGQVSFCFYLVHELTLLNVREVADPGGLAGALFFFAIAAAAAVLLHHTVELPMQRVLRPHFTSRPPVGSSADESPGARQPEPRVRSGVRPR